jgi:hypothetical protein
LSTEGRPLAASVASHDAKRVERLHSGAFGSRMVELHHLDRLLGQLARPARLDEGVPEGFVEELRGLGLAVRRRAGREDLVRRIWSRKRPLLRELFSADDPMPPCA